LGYEAEYAHFGFFPDEDVRKLIERADVVIIPERPDSDVLASWGQHRRNLIEHSLKTAKRFMPELRHKGAHFMDVDKGAHSSWQFTGLLTELGCGWTSDAIHFFDEWPVICSQHTAESKRDRLALTSARMSRATL